MDEQRSRPAEPTLIPDITITHPQTESTGGPAGFAGSAGIPAELPAGPSRKQAPLPGFESYFPPLELDNSTKSLTTSLLDQWGNERVSNKGAVINIFPSGEITGGFYRTGRRTIPVKREKVVSQEFTRQARKTIRRAVECGATNFKLFVTLTFDPKQAQLDETGRVDQEWAKKELKRFLNTVKKKYDRRVEKRGKEEQGLSYIWVAEIQELNTKNIHFHILIDQPFIPATWLVEIWGQAAGSVNVVKVSNQEHAARYMLKYMSKGHCPIEGKRYGMTQNLLDKIKPQKIRFEGENRREAFGKVKRDYYWEIEQHGGKVTDFGFFIPAPRRARTWKDKQGKVHTSRGVPRNLSANFLKAVKKRMEPIDFEEEVDVTFHDKNPDDVPF
jgi:hypothetical protein